MSIRTCIKTGCWGWGWHSYSLDLRCGTPGKNEVQWQMESLLSIAPAAIVGGNGVAHNVGSTLSDTPLLGQNGYGQKDP